MIRRRIWISMSHWNHSGFYFVSDVLTEKILILNWLSYWINNEKLTKFLFFTYQLCSFFSSSFSSSKYFFKTSFIFRFILTSVVISLLGGNLGDAIDYFFWGFGNKIEEIQKLVTKWWTLRKIYIIFLRLNKFY